MKTSTDQSYGVIPLYNADGTWRVFVIHQYGSTGDVFWGFPKGHAETGEKPLEAARRELEEETGLQVARWLVSEPLEQHYTFVHEDRMIAKTVQYFMGVVDTTEYVPQVDEVRAGEWLTFPEARERLTHDSARALLDQTVAHLPQ